MSSASPSQNPMDLDHTLRSFEALVSFVSNAKKALKSDLRAAANGLGNGSASNEINPQATAPTPVPEPATSDDCPRGGRSCWSLTGSSGTGDASGSSSKGQIDTGDANGPSTRDQVDNGDSNGPSTRGQVDNGDSNGPSARGQMDDDAQKLCNQAEKLHRDLNYIKGEISKLKDLKEDFHTLEEQSLKVNGILPEGGGEFPSQQVQDKFQLLTEKLKKVKKKMPGHKMSSQINESHQAAVGAVFGPYCVFERIPKSEELKRKMKTIVMGTSAFQEFLDDFVGVFDSLDRQIKLCLFCLSIFPENAVLDKRLLVHWWIGEGLVDPPLTGEITADDILNLLLSRGFLEPLMKKRKLVGFQMDPLVRFVVITIAEKAGFFDFDDMGVPTARFSWSYRACLVRTGKDFSAKEFKNKEPSYLEKLRTLFNVNDPYPDFPQELFGKFKNLSVLFLGRWGGSSRHHIEVESTEFLKGVKNMKHLKFLSLGGISRINDLPDEICELSNLRIMDLNACYNLETLPKTLSKLKNLTHLDISECFLLDHIPKGLASLTKLEVLKGFVIGGSGNMTEDSCALKDLENLQKLRKLSISTTMRNFPSVQEVNILQKFEVLKKLTISWGGNSSKSAEESDHRAPDSSPIAKLKQNKSLKRALAFKADRDEGPRKTLEQRQGGLETLELQCYPTDTAPKWMFQELKPHKKLYIKGGNMKILGNKESTTIRVNILCLKFLAELKMDWKELRKSFPELMYLETVRCPNLTFFPCDESGIWRDKAVKPEQLEGAKLGFSWSFFMSSTIPSNV